MSDINWNDGAVCYANGEQHKYNLNKLENLIIFDDFQLNEIREGDSIEASELDTEQKYNDVVEVFELLGFEFEIKEFDFVTYNYIIDDERANIKISSEGYLVGSLRSGNRKLTYHQIIAIGKLKRMMLERAKSGAISGADLTADNSDQVKNPKHYQLIEGVESIEIIARSMTKEQWKGFCLGNMLKYRIRAGKKDALQQDIEKANFYGDLYEMHKEKCYD